MLEQPPLLTIRRGFRRPPPDVLDRFRGAETAQTADAQGGRGALDYRIRPIVEIASGSTIVGPALTCETGPADVLGALAALDLAEPGDILVIAAAGWRGTATIGDQFAGAARNAGLAAIVTDGLVRDVDGLERAGVPVFAAGLSPNSPAATGPGTAGLSVLLGGLPVDAGDIVVCDRTGVVVVPRLEAESTAAALERVQRLEAAEAERVAAGQVVPEGVRELLASDRVREIE